LDFQLASKKKGLNKHEIINIVNQSSKIGRTRIGIKIDELVSIGDIQMSTGTRTEKIYKVSSK